MNNKYQSAIIPQYLVPEFIIFKLRYLRDEIAVLFVELYETLICIIIRLYLLKISINV